jgi:hypothetical protein
MSDDAHSAGMRILGSATVPVAGFGVLAETNFFSGVFRNGSPFCSVGFHKLVPVPQLREDQRPGPRDCGTTRGWRHFSCSIPAIA